MSPVRTALITGASAGIGKAFAELLASQGYQLILVARRTHRLQALKTQLQNQYGVRVEYISADLSLPQTPIQVIDEVERRGLTVDFLVNNAGYSKNQNFAETGWQDHADELQVMLLAVTELAWRLIPNMKARHWGRIINLSSLAAFAPPTTSMLYTGIKSYVLNFSQALDMELKPHGINVTALCPGFTYSEFHDVMGTREQANRVPEILWMPAEEVAKAGYDAVMRGKPLCIPGLVNKTLASGSKLLPESLRYQLGLNNPLFD